MHQSIILLGWPESSLRCFRAILWENPNPLFGQPPCFSLGKYPLLLVLDTLWSTGIVIPSPEGLIILVSFLAKFSGMMSTYWCPRSHCSFFRVFSVLVYHSCWIYLRAGKSTPVKLCRGLNRKSFTWLLHNSALTHATQNPVVPVTCHLVRLSRLGRKCFLTVWVWRCKVSLLPLFPRVALPQTGTCWGVIRAVLIWTAKSWLQWEEKQEMF